MVNSYSDSGDVPLFISRWCSCFTQCTFMEPKDKKAKKLLDTSSPKQHKVQKDKQTRGEKAMDKAVGSYITYQKEAEQRYQEWEVEYLEKEPGYRNNEMKFNCFKCGLVK